MIQTEISGNGAPIFAPFKSRAPEIDPMFNANTVLNLRSVFNADKVREEAAQKIMAESLAKMQLEKLQPKIAANLAGEWEAYSDKWINKFKNSPRGVLSSTDAAERLADQAQLINKATWAQELQNDALKTIPLASTLKAKLQITDRSWDNLNQWWDNFAKNPDLGSVPMPSTLLEKRQPFVADKFFRGLADAQNSQLTWDPKRAEQTYLSENDKGTKDYHRQMLEDDYGVNPEFIRTDEGLAEEMAKRGELEWKKGKKSGWFGYWGKGGEGDLTRGKYKWGYGIDSEGNPMWQNITGILTSDDIKSNFTKVKLVKKTGQVMAGFSIQKMKDAGLDQGSIATLLNGGKVDPVNKDIIWRPMDVSHEAALINKQMYLPGWNPGSMSVTPIMGELPAEAPPAPDASVFVDPNTSATSADLKEYYRAISSMDDYRVVSSIKDKTQGLRLRMAEYQQNHPEQFKAAAPQTATPKTKTFKLKGTSASLDLTRTYKLSDIKGYFPGITDAQVKVLQSNGVIIK